MKDEKKKTKRKCPKCSFELGEYEDICPNCGACLEEPCYDIENDIMRNREGYNNYYTVNSN